MWHVACATHYATCGLQPATRTKEQDVLQIKQFDGESAFEELAADWNDLAGAA
jgi:hypothetical protein